jgi:thiosulfate/3-mercaptopyruvate sulfurtransferase
MPTANLLPLSLLAFCAVRIAAQDVNKTMLISCGELATLRDDKQLVILHVGTRTDYGAGHIPGARLITLADISITGERGLRLELPPTETLLLALGKLGIDNDSRVVIYPGTDSIQSATRIWFTFDYLGLGDRASLLDGGLSLWRAEGRETSTETPVWESKTLSAKPRPELVVDAEYIQSHSGQASVRLIDARAPEFYSGASAGSMPRAGHIPGAYNTPFTNFFDASKKLKPQEQLRDLLAVPAGSSAITYCHIGQQATVPYFVARYLGMQPRLYDGSFQDWSMRSELPVATSPSK